MSFLFRQHKNTSVNKANRTWGTIITALYLHWDVTKLSAWSVTPLRLFLSSTSNILTLLWCKPSKVRDKVKVHMPSLVQRGRRDTATLVLDLGYRWWGGWSHHTQPIYPQERDQALNGEEARWAPGPAWMRIVKRISCPTGVWASVSHTNYPLKPSKV